MTREQTNELLPAIQHFADGGNLWGHDDQDGWYEQFQFWCDEGGIHNIIEDKHFKVRKAFALGASVQYRENSAMNWKTIAEPKWENWTEYSITSKKPVYEYQYFYINDVNNFFEFTGFFTDKEAEELDKTRYTKFEISKRRKLK